MRLVRVASASLLVIASAIAADAAPPPAPAPAVPREYTTQPTRTVSVSGVGDPKQVAKIALHVTSDGGKSWRKAQELVVPEGAAAIPAFTFTADADGAYGLWTVSTSHNGQAEAEPVSGVAPKSVLVVDRAAPSLDRLESTLGGVSAGQASIAVSWKVTDPNLGKDPVSLEVSTDQGKSFAAKASGEAEGTTGLAVALPDNASEVQVRLIARDLAGNVLTSAAKVVALPVQAKPADPEARLAAAVASLPKPEELGVATRAPIVTAGENPLADAPKPVDSKPAAIPAVGPAPATVAATEEAPVANRDVEARFAHQANPSTAQRTRAGDAAAPNDVASPVAAPASPRAVAPDPEAPYLIGAEAQTALDRARTLRKDGDTEGALAIYLRLQRSSVGKEAVAEELAVLRSVGDRAAIIGIAGALPPELRTDAARLAAARANLELGNADTAIAWAARVRNNADEAREALFVLAKGLNAKGRATEAKRIFTQLAGGDDEIAAQARLEK